MVASEKRKAISSESLKEVLVSCRRRCCICYGLSCDLSVKKGQIAHLDHDRANNSKDNLAFLCLEHHDEYDGQTSQSKGLTLAEVRHFRDELHSVVQAKWRTTTLPDEEDDSWASRVVGHYVQETWNTWAEFEIRNLGNNRLQIKGFALWGTDRELGPNMGDISFEGEFVDGRIAYRDGVDYLSRGDGNRYELKLRFGEYKLWAEEENAWGRFGMNVSFAGEYVKIPYGTAQGYLE